MKPFEFDPVHDARWKEFVGRHPKASVFHSPEWLEALRLTYGYEPVVFTTSPPADELKNGLVCCEINSWLTGRRLVSLPFSDHCAPLFDSREDLHFLVDALKTKFDNRKWKYIEARPIDENTGQLYESAGFHHTARYFLHVVELQGNLGEVFGRLAKDSIQRRIHHADRVGLVQKCSTSEDSLREFYNLFVLTRGRHQLPPMPYAWFQNLIASMKNALEIRIAYFGDTPVSAILTLRFRDVLYYKYGCSDARFKHLGATPWLLWQAVTSAKASGAVQFDMGRTEEDNAGLLTFKNHWVSSPQQLVYWKFPGCPGFDSINNRKLKVAKLAFSVMPNALLKVTGRLIYRHIG